MSTEPPFEIPIAFCIFNRPETTRQVFESIARRKPTRLLIIADGARTDSPAECDLVRQTRNIVSQVDWPCAVEHNYSETNLGCRQRMASGLTWAFSRCEELIVLEDDCLPNDSFFEFCKSLLPRYRNTPEVMMISGNNFQPSSRTMDSYYFSRYTHIWGWASWRRAWDHYDLNMLNWPKIRNGDSFESLFQNPDETKFWRELFDRQHAGEIDTWDYAWEYACMSQAGLAILPNVNLVSNLGFGPDATHTLDAGSAWSNLPAQHLTHLKHPNRIRRNSVADDWTFENIFRPERPNSAPVPGKRWYQKLADSLTQKSA